MPNIEPLLMNVRQAAAYVGIGRTKMHELIQSKKIRVHMLGDRIKVSVESLRAFVAGLPDEYGAGQPVKDGTHMARLKARRARPGKRKARH